MKLGSVSCGYCRRMRPSSDPFCGCKEEKAAEKERWDKSFAEMEQRQKAFAALSTKAQNALKRNELKDHRGFRQMFNQPVDQPWHRTVKDLLKIKGIGPAAIKEIAEVAERFCL